MRTLFLLLALLLIAASPPCGAPSASSAGNYGTGTGAREEVTSSDNVLTVDEDLGDRGLTHIVSRYDAVMLRLLSSERTAGYAGRQFVSTISRNTDGSYDLESTTVLNTSQPDDVYNESRPHLKVPADTPVIIGGFFLIPWIYHTKHPSRFLEIGFDPLRADYLSVSDASPSPYPDAVPHRDKALRVSAVGPDTTLWYDPCTFALDAYRSGGYLIVRSALLE